MKFIFIILLFTVYYSHSDGTNRGTTPNASTVTDLEDLCKKNKRMCKQQVREQLYDCAFAKGQAKQYCRNICFSPQNINLQTYEKQCATEKRNSLQTKLQASCENLITREYSLLVCAGGTSAGANSNCGNYCRKLINKEIKSTSNNRCNTNNIIQTQGASHCEQEINTKINSQINQVAIAAKKGNSKDFRWEACAIGKPCEAKIQQGFNIAKNKCQSLKRQALNCCGDSLQNCPAAGTLKLTSTNANGGSISQTCEALNKELSNINTTVEAIAQQCRQDANTCKQSCTSAINQASHFLDQICKFDVRKNDPLQKHICSEALINKYTTYYQQDLISAINACHSMESQRASIATNVAKDLLKGAMDASNCAEAATDKWANSDAQDNNANNNGGDSSLASNSESLAIQNKRVGEIEDSYVKKTPDLKSSLSDSGSRASGTQPELTANNNQAGAGGSSAPKQSLSGASSLQKAGSVPLQKSGSAHLQKSSASESAPMQAGKKNKDSYPPPSTTREESADMEQDCKTCKKDLRLRANEPSTLGNDSQNKKQLATNDRKPSSVNNPWNLEKRNYLKGMHTRTYAPPSANIFELISKRFQSLCQRQIIKNCWD